MTQGRLRAASTLALAGALCSGTARALPWEMGLGNWSGGLGLHYEGATQTRRSAEGPESTSSNRLLRETGTIANSGFYIVDPRLFTGTATLDLGLSRNRDSNGGSSETSSGRLLGYSFASTFLAEKPYTASLFANRTQTQSLQLFGGRTDQTRDNRRADFRLRQDSVLNDWGFPWFESRLELRSEHNKSRTSIFGQSLQMNEASDTLLLDASKGFEHADLGVNLQVNERKNATFEAGNFTSKAAGVSYSLDFGPELNRRLDARVNYLSRGGTAPATTTSTNEHLHIDHLRNLSTDYLYTMTRQEVAGQASTFTSGAFTVAHRLYQNLNTKAGLNANRATLVNGTTTAYGGQLNQSYQHRLPGDGRFSANWSGAYRLNSNELKAARINVTDEGHTAPSLFAVEHGFLLDHPFADPNNIQVFNVRGGGRIPLVAGVDYDVIAEGNQLRIAARPGTLLIAEGDPLVVSYSYRVDQNLRYSTKATGFGIGADYRWIAASFDHRQSKQTPLGESTFQFLSSYTQNALRLSSRGQVRDLPVNANLDFERYSSTFTAYDRRRLASTLQWPLTARIRMNFGLNASDTRYTLPSQHRNLARSAQSAVNWTSESGWRNSASLDWTRYSDTGTPAQTLVRATWRSSLALGKLTLSGGLDFSESSTNGLHARNLGFNIDAVRRF